MSASVWFPLAAIPPTNQKGEFQVGTRRDLQDQSWYLDKLTLDLSLLDSE